MQIGELENDLQRNHHDDDEMPEKHLDIYPAANKLADADD